MACRLIGASHYLNQCWNIVNWNLRNKLQWNFNRNSYIFIQEYPFVNGVWKMASILSRPKCVNKLDLLSSSQMIKEVIAAEYYIYHDSRAVRACSKCLTDLVAQAESITNHFFHFIGITIEKIVGEWGMWPACHCRGYLSWHPVLYSSLCNSFKDRAPVDVMVPDLQISCSDLTEIIVAWWHHKVT